MRAKKHGTKSGTGAPLRREFSLLPHAPTFPSCPSCPCPAPPPTVSMRKPTAILRETLELATAGAARVLGPDHGVTKALAKAAITMANADLWQARERPSHNNLHFL